MSVARDVPSGAAVGDVVDILGLVDGALADDLVDVVDSAVVSVVVKASLTSSHANESCE